MCAVASWKYQIDEDTGKPRMQTPALKVRSLPSVSILPALAVGSGLGYAYASVPSWEGAKAWETEVGCTVQ